MEIKRLLHFRAVVEAGSIVGAAQTLHVTPGTVSKAVQQLERELGRDLFRRDSRRLVANQAGWKLYRESHSLMNEYARLRHSLDGIEPTSTQLRIASFEVFATYVLSDVLKQGLAEGDVAVREMAVDDISGAVRSREADLGITYVPDRHRDLSFVGLGSITFGSYARSKVFANRRFDDVPYAVPINPLHGVTSELAALDGWPYGKIARNVRYQLTSLESALACARHGLCAVLIPDFIARLHNRVAARACHLEPIAHPTGVGSITQEVYALTRGDLAPSSFQQRFVAQLKRVISGAGHAA